MLVFILYVCYALNNEEALEFWSSQFSTNDLVTVKDYKEKGFGLITKFPLTEGQPSLELPFDRILVGPLTFELSPYISHVHPNTQLKIRIIYEKYIGSDSFFTKYVRFLSESFTMPKYWSQEEIEYVKNLGIFDPNTLITSSFEEYSEIRSLLERVPGIPEEMKSYEAYEWAEAIMKSRSFSIDLTLLAEPLGIDLNSVTDVKSVMLLPLIDLANHSPKPKWSNYPDVPAIVKSKHGMNLVADRNYSIGEEFTFQYSRKLGNKHLLKSYGFTIEKNKLDYFLVKFNDTCFESLVEGICNYKLSTNTINFNLLKYINYARTGEREITHNQHLKALIEYRVIRDTYSDKIEKFRQLKNLKGQFEGNNEIGIHASVALVQTILRHIQLIDMEILKILINFD